MRFIPLIIVLIVIISLSVVFLNKWLGMINDGYSRNPFKWAQERRRQENEKRARRIKALEHDLGYRPCSDEHCLDRKCIVSKVRNGGHPIWDNPALPAPPPMIPIDDLAKKAYDRQVHKPIYPLYKYGRTSSGGPK